MYKLYLTHACRHSFIIFNTFYHFTFPGFPFMLILMPNLFSMIICRMWLNISLCWNIFICLQSTSVLLGITHWTLEIWCFKVTSVVENARVTYLHLWHVWNYFIIHETLSLKMSSFTFKLILMLTLFLLLNLQQNHLFHLHKIWYTRTRWKVRGPAYLKFGTSGRWVGTRTGAISPPNYKYDKVFLVAAHDSMGISSSIWARFSI